MMCGTYRENVRKTFIPEFISMNAMMSGMAPVMALLMMGRDMRAMVPDELIFWGVMSLGVIAGFAVAYPVNAWMVARNLKHGLMTKRDAAGSKDHGAHARHAESAPHASHHQEAALTSNKATHGGHHSMEPDVTRPQLASVAGFSLLMLAAGMVLPALVVNMRLSARDVGGAIMP